MENIRKQIKKSTKIVTILMLVVMVSVSVSKVMGTTTGSLTMTNAGQITIVDLSRELPAGIQPANVRIAMFDGVSWLEIAFKPQQVFPSTPSTVGISNVGNMTARTVHSANGQAMSKLLVTFRMPQPVGWTASASNWWNIASALELNNRISFTLQDTSNHQLTTLYAYYRTTGFAPSPNFPTLSYTMAKGAVNSTATPTANDEMLRGPFALSSMSSPANQFSSSTPGDPPVYANLCVVVPTNDGCQSQQFQNTYRTIQNFNVELPQNQLGYNPQWYVSGSTTTDAYLRELDIYFNGNLIYTTNVQNSFSIGIGMTMPPGVNTVGIELTTVNYNNDFWNVNSNINVNYAASQYIDSGVGYFSTNYKFQGTGQTYQYFNAWVPNGVVGPVTLTLQFTDHGDNYLRVFDVLVNGNEVTPNDCGVPSQGTCRSGSFTWTTPQDITGLVAYQGFVQVGVKLTTSNYNNDWWTLWGTLNGNARYQVWPDSDIRWTNNDHPIAASGAVLFDTVNIIGNHWLVAPSMEIKTKEHQAYPYFEVGATEHIPDWVQNDYRNLDGNLGRYDGFYTTNEIHISIKDSSGNLLPQTDYPSNQVYGYVSPNNSGNDISGVASDTLAILAALASILPGGQFAAAPPAIASVLVKYLPASFSVGTESTGVFLKDTSSGSRLDLSDLLKFQVTLPNGGTYTVNVSVTSSFHWLEVSPYGVTDYTLSTQTFSFSGTYNF